MAVNATDLTAYIADSHAAGMDSEAIAASLREAGWSMADIIRSLAGVSHTVPPAIAVHDVAKSFGKTKALDGVSMEIAPGTITALLGPNGAGKTTLVRILATLMRPDAGTATVAGFDIGRHAQDIRSAIGLAGQYAAVDERMTGRENLEMVGRLYHLSSQAARVRAAELLERFSLSDAADRILKTYSGGMRRRLDLAASLVNNPQILFLDEPTTGLDPQSRQALWAIVQQLAADGTTVLLTTQYLEEADQLADRIIVIDHGRVIAGGTPGELKSRLGGDRVALRLADHSKQDAAVRTLANVGIEVAEVAVHQPSLDEVFIALTHSHERR